MVAPFCLVGTHASRVPAGEDACGPIWCLVSDFAGGDFGIDFDLESIRSNDRVAAGEDACVPI